MTNPPLPPSDYPPPPSDGGGYPPPPPSSGGYAPPPTGGAYPPPGGYTYAPAAGGAYGAGSPEAYTPWFTRVLAWLIDWLPVGILSGLGSILLVTMQKVETVCITDSSEYQLGDFCATGNNGPSGLAWILYGVLELVALAFVIWNLGYKQGTTGSSIGKGIMRFKIVSEATGAPIGFGMSILRQLVYFVANAFFFLPWLVAVLFPLWDAKRQTLVDKVIKTVALPL